MNDTEVVLNEDDGSVRLLLAVTDEDGQMTCSSDFEIIVAMYTLPGTAGRDSNPHLMVYNNFL